MRRLRNLVFLAFAGIALFGVSAKAYDYDWSCSQQGAYFVCTFDNGPSCSDFYADECNGPSDVVDSPNCWALAEANCDDSNGTPSSGACYWESTGLCGDGGGPGCYPNEWGCASDIDCCSGWCCDYANCGDEGTWLCGIPG